MYYIYTFVCHFFFLFFFFSFFLFSFVNLFYFVLHYPFIYLFVPANHTKFKNNPFIWSCIHKSLFFFLYICKTHDKVWPLMMIFWALFLLYGLCTALVGALVKKWAPGHALGKERQRPRQRQKENINETSAAPFRSL